MIITSNNLLREPPCLENDRITSNKVPSRQISPASHGQIDEDPAGDTGRLDNNRFAKDRRTKNSTSNTWTSPSEDAGVSDSDVVQEREGFVQEYNKLAKKV